MKAILKRLGPPLRAAGFAGSGQNYRKTEGDFRFVINIQGSRSGDRFFVNLGAQPVFIPAEGDADLEQLKEYQCVLRRRVGNDWPWDPPDAEADALESAILAGQARFFGHAQTMRAAIAHDSPNVLIENFACGTTAARACLHLARAASVLGFSSKAHELAARGIELASEGASALKTMLQPFLTEKESTP